MISEKTIEHLAGLARIKLGEKQKEKIAKYLETILSYFKELADLNTNDVLPVTGGTELVNVSRKDEEDLSLAGLGKVAFPEEEGGFLKVPAVFNELPED